MLAERGMEFRWVGALFHLVKQSAVNRGRTRNGDHLHRSRSDWPQSALLHARQIASVTRKNCGGRRRFTLRRSRSDFLA
jgi:hypothetical protein